ncbi:unnamed protein product [Rhizophagus irregularis]|nr:unnamed protein product [Rhizophagus irregularis]
MEIPFACTFIEALASYDNANHASYLLNFFSVRYKAYEERYSLVLEYAEGGTLRNYLKNNVIEWSTQLRVIPYVDPKAFDRKTPYKMNEKSDIYSLAVTFWELTSHSSPFNYETMKDHTSLMLDILNGLREKPIPNTNVKFKDVSRN